MGIFRSQAEPGIRFLQGTYKIASVIAFSKLSADLLSAACRSAKLGADSSNWKREIVSVKGNQGGARIPRRRGEQSAWHHTKF